MIFALIGHRGTGKTTLLERIARYYRDVGRIVTTIDLDRQIATRAGSSIADLFAQHGEDHFRQLEHATLHDIVSRLQARPDQSDVYISVGAGYRGELPAGLHIVWIRRVTDSLGRVFIDDDRPRLSPHDAPLTESLKRFSSREARYQELHHDVWFLREGLDSALPKGDSPTQEAERSFVMSALATSPQPPDPSLGGVLSLLPHNLRERPSGPSFADWIARRLAWRDVRFELRDDLLDDDQLSRAMTMIPAARRILSFRRPQRTLSSIERAASSEQLWDFPLELAHLQTPHAPPILSLHERLADESLYDAAERLVREGARLSARLLKLAVETRDFSELLTGWRWAQSDPSHRTFLPRADPKHAGRWRWFRLLTAATSPIAFFREGDGTSLDQPLLAEWWQLAAAVGGHGSFAAVIGDPIEHSRTPVEHAAFFARRGMPIFAIKLSEAELPKGGLDALKQLGMRYAAITSPLKRSVAAILHAHGELSPQTPSVNTLYYSEPAQRWFADNTDLVGAHALLAPIAQGSAVAVWGGGGTLSVLRAVLPNARFFSSRTGQARELREDSAWRPTALVWASGSAENGSAPDPGWTPRAVYDLSYGDDSAGREYALRIGARYVSGLAMFFAQAAAQRDFFTAAEARLTDKKS